MKDAKKHTVRIGRHLKDELEKIRLERLNNGYDSARISMRVMTNLIVKHKYWPQIREEMIELDLGGLNE